MSKTDDDVPDLPTDSDLDGSEGEEEEEEEEEEDRLTLYDAETFISGPFQSEKCTIPEDILEFYTSFGYDCRRYYNLCVPDPDNLVFASGNFINFFNVDTREITYRRSALSGGIGHIKNNPNPEISHLAVAENAFHYKPLIVVYEWPSLEINCVLKEGSSKTYTNIDYSPDGMLLASQGGEPDYLITVWNWPKRRILLRTKSYVNDVHRIKFSPYCPGQLTTGGISHIKFWKMANTFTGLKLKGEVGRFGKTEYSDILGVLPMPDEKVLSGCSWGNILVWDGGLIKLEVFRTLRRKCHEAPIVQIHYDEGELWTVGMDGHIRVWWYEKIDQADPPDDDRVVQIEPTYDFYTEGLMLMCLRKRYPDPLDAHYFAQDGNGGIWYLDLNTEEDPEPAVQLFKCHAGQVRDISTCPWGPYVVSLGSGGKLLCYNYLLKKMMFAHQFPAAGRRIIWVPSTIAPHGDELILGFDDGTVRVCIFTTGENFEINLTQMTKPHNKPITQMVLNKYCDVLVTGGEDATIFIFQVTSFDYVQLVPIGYINVPTEVTYLTWHMTHTEEVLVGCLRGELMQVRVPKNPQDYTTVTLVLHVEPQENKFKTYKAQIRRDIKIAEIEARKAVKVEKKRVELEKLKKENPGLDIDEEVFLADSETEEELEPLHIPEVPNQVLWIQSTPENTVWLSMGGYDAGYVYEYKMKQTNEVPLYFRMVDDADDIEISNFIYNYNQKYLIFAMQDGTIRVNKKQEGKTFREDLSDYWTLAMHDNLNGFVPRMCFSYDEKFFFTCGLDNNLFVYRFIPEDDDYIPESRFATITERTIVPNFIPDRNNYKTLSLEEHSLKVEQDRIDALANANKKVLRGKLRALAERFSKVIDRNAELLPSQRLTMAQLELDARVTQDLNSKLEEMLALVKRKLAYDVEKAKLGMEKLLSYFIESLDFYPITVKQMNKPLNVKMLRQRRIADAHWNMLEVVEQKILEAELKGRPPERPPIAPKPPPPKKIREKTMEYFLINLSPSVIALKLGPKLSRLLTKYRERKMKWERREDDWDEFMAKKPIQGVNHPEDEAALAEAKKTIGDYKLKSASDYKATRETQETTVKKYKQLLLTRIRQFAIRHDYNQKVFDQRTKKQELREELAAYQRNLEYIHEEIAEKQIKGIPTFEAEDPEEFPEKNLEITDVLRVADIETPEPPIVVIPEYSQDFAEKAAILIKQIRRYDYDSVKPLIDQVAAVPTIEFQPWFLKTAGEHEDTPYEAEVRVRRLWRKLFEQDRTIDVMCEKIDKFNEEIEDLFEEHFEVHTAGTFMDLHVLELHQELIVLKDFESLEDALQEKVHQRMTEVLDMQDAIKSSYDDSHAHETNIMRLNEECSALAVHFQQTMCDNKFFTFLRRVWKKKYKLPKIRTGDESSSSESSSSSSSSEEEGDTGSIDSRDFGIIKLDLNVCPKGCDPNMFEMTVSLRTQRHEKEIRIKEEQKRVEEVKKTLELQHKKIKLLEHTLKLSQDDLEKYQHEKQKKLNEIHCTVMMKLHQFQHMTPEGKTSNILDTLVFPKLLLSKLYKRVDDLVGEKVAQNSLHNINVKHLTRMTTDCKYMRKSINTLKQDIVEMMKIKFGQKVDIADIEAAILRRSLGQKDLNDLEEVVMRKLVTKLRLSLMDIKGMYADEMKLWRDNVDKVQQELIDTLKDNTNRKDLLAVLSKEKAELLKFVYKQDKKNEHLDETLGSVKEYLGEIKKLEAILCDQCRQMQELKDEIKVLKTKGYPPKPVRDSHVEPVDELLEPQWEFEEFVSKRTDYEYEYVAEEEMVRPFGKTIAIPALLDERSEAVATELITEMLEALNVSLEKKSDENFIKQIVSSVMTKFSIEDMIEELIRQLPIEPDDDQIGIVETTAEQLFSIEDVEEDPAPGDMLESIIDDVIISTEGPTEMLSELVRQLYDSLPLEFILRKESMEVIAERIINAHLEAELDKKELMTAAINDEMKIILSEILNTVYGIGIDYLYYIE